MGGSKNVKEHNEKKGFFILYQRTKFQKLGSLKNEKAKQNLANYIKCNPLTISLFTILCLAW